jgi:two-component system sensor histidine kinase/response regulator
VDYISKPFQLDEVHARVETHLELHSLQRALHAHNERLEEAVVARTNELSVANERLSILDHSKNDFLNLISHEFRTPLNGVLGVAEVILDGMPATEENQTLKEVFDGSRQRLLSILDDALLLTQIDVNGGNFRYRPISLHEALDRAIERVSSLADSRNVTFDTPGTNWDQQLVLGCEDLLVSALHALLDTAVKFSNHKGKIHVAGHAALESQIITIETSGRIVPDHTMSKFFDLFSIAEAITPGGDLGLGPPLAHRILSLFGGSVSVENRCPSGIRLTVTLKLGSE